MKPITSVRAWSGARLFVTTLVCWLVGYVSIAGLFVAPDRARRDAPLLVFLLFASVLWLAGTSLVAVVWAWGRRDLRRFHPGKLLVLWAALLGAAYGAELIASDFGLPAFVLGGAPLAVFSWSWLSCRE
jgi:hypothetical protein